MTGLYNLCFKFYKKMITYEDYTNLLEDMRSYYYLLMTKVLKDQGFEVKDMYLDKYMNALKYNKGEFYYEKRSIS